MTRRPAMAPLIATLATLALSACVFDDTTQEIELSEGGSATIIGCEVSLDIGDIAFETSVENVVVETEGRVLADKSIMMVGETLDFIYEGKTYRIKVVDLVEIPPSLDGPTPDEIGLFRLTSGVNPRP